MFLKNKKKISNHVNKFDKLITWLIVWWAVASVLGLSKTKKGREISKATYKWWKWIMRKSYSLFWKILLKFIRIFNKK